MEKDMDREQEIRKLENLIQDAEHRIIESNLDLQAALWRLRHARGHLPRFREMNN
jgi:hypothetical protein